MLFNRFHRLYHVPCFPMLVIILRLPIVLMVNHDEPIRVIQIFADDPTMLCVIGEKFNIPLRYPYDGKISFPDHPFLFLCEHKLSFECFNDMLKDFNDYKTIVKKRCKIAGQKSPYIVAANLKSKIQIRKTRKVPYFNPFQPFCIVSFSLLRCSLATVAISLITGL